MQILDYFSYYYSFKFREGNKVWQMPLCPSRLSATILNAGDGMSFMLDFAPLNKQSKLLKFQIHNPVRAAVVPITHDEVKSVNWSIYNGQVV